MQIYNDLTAITKPFIKPCVTIGNFDGVHLGHQMLFSEVVSKAYHGKGTSVAITFDPHPLKVVRPESGIKLISTFEQKREMIAFAGIDVLIVIHFSREFATMPAQNFVDEILVHRLGVSELVVGYDYAFGRGRQGDIPFLKEQGAHKGFAVTVVEPFYIDDMLVSSTQIRELVTLGRMQEVRKLLGRYYQIRGIVRVGKKRGGPVVGFPTANLHISEEDLVPQHGVYVTQVIHDGKCYGGVLNIGYNPTFGDGRLSAETHIFDFNQNIYGNPIKINFLKFLRAERKFSGPTELAEQITKDAAQARQILSEAEQEVRLSCEEKFNQ